MGQAGRQKKKEVVQDVSSVIRAAGGVLWRISPTPRNGEPEIEVAVIHRPRYDDWSFPKGKLSKNESFIEGALREVLEETGFRVKLGRSLGETRYWKKVGGTEREKVVRYWAMQEDGGSFSRNNEVDEVRWLPLAEARELLTYRRDQELLDRFARGPSPMGEVLLVRHATAGSRQRWTGDDRQRPLDERGWDQADGLLRVLSHFGVTDIYSADVLRCEQTVIPLSEAIGVPIKSEPLFSEEGYPGREEEAEKFVRSVASPEGATVICSQGDVVPHLLRGLADRDEFDLPEDFEYKKGSTWVLGFDKDRLVAADYISPEDEG
jgi:8-oxo-(d)GTP phosphatase